MKKNDKNQRQKYSLEFKQQAIELAGEIGIPEATEKLGIKNLQTLAAWVRYSKRNEKSNEFKDLEQARDEIKRLKKELLKEKKVTAILKDATAFFCQDHLK